MARPEPSIGAPSGSAERWLPLPTDCRGPYVLELRQRLLRQAADPGVRRIVVECAGVEELAPYLLTVLVAASRMLRTHGGVLDLMHPSDAVQRELDRLGLAKVLMVSRGSSSPGGQVSRE